MILHRSFCKYLEASPDNVARSLQVTTSSFAVDQRKENHPSLVRTCLDAVRNNGCRTKGIRKGASSLDVHENRRSEFKKVANGIEQVLASPESTYPKRIEAVLNRSTTTRVTAPCGLT